jgi:hypothetical protein
MKKKNIIIILLFILIIIIILYKCDLFISLDTTKTLVYGLNYTIYNNTTSSELNLSNLGINNSNNISNISTKNNSIKINNSFTLSTGIVNNDIALLSKSNNIAILWYGLFYPYNYSNWQINITSTNNTKVYVWLGDNINPLFVLPTTSNSINQNILLLPSVNYYSIQILYINNNSNNGNDFSFSITPIINSSSSILYNYFNYYSNDNNINNYI